MKRCEVCGKIAWRGRTILTASGSMNPKKIAINGKEYTGNVSMRVLYNFKLCKKCTDDLLNMVIETEGKL